MSSMSPTDIKIVRKQEVMFFLVSLTNARVRTICLSRYTLKKHNILNTSLFLMFNPSGHGDNPSRSDVPPSFPRYLRHSRSSRCFSPVTNVYYNRR